MPKKGAESSAIFRLYVWPRGHWQRWQFIESLRNIAVAEYYFFPAERTEYYQYLSCENDSEEPEDIEIGHNLWIGKQMACTC